MGCISSKIVTRSRSIREELSQSLQRRVNGFPVLEDILNSKNAGDQLLALVCTANTVAKKLQNGTCATDSSAQEDLPYKQTNHETINAKELMADLEEEEEEEEGPKQQPSIEQHDKEGIASRSFWQDTNGNVADDGGIPVCSRSIRTVEEHDALVQASNGWSQAEQDIDFGHSIINANELLVESTGSSFKESSAVKEDDSIAEEWKEVSMVDDRETNPAEAPVVVVVVNIEDGNETTGKSSRRKGKAKELGNLSIPTTIDFPVSLESSGDCTQLQGETFSNGDYDTPRFGSFSTMNSINCSRECCVFDPELLASLEEAMKQMTEEEESIIQKIVESLEEEEGVLEEEDKEWITGQIQGTILQREHGAGF